MVQRSNESQVIDPVICEHRPEVGVDEQACRERNDQVTVRDAAVEKRVLRGGGLVHVCVEGVAGKFGEMVDIVERDFSQVAPDRIAEFELLEGLAERVHTGILLVRATQPAMTDDRKGLGRALDRRTLHIVLDAPNATHFLAAAGAPRPAVDEMRQR